MKLLLTGATGFLGANVLRVALAQGHEVVCVVRRPNRCVEGLPTRLVNVGLEDVDGLTAAAEGCGGVLHVAGSYDTGPDGIATMRRLHVDAARALVEVSRRVGARFVYCSSSITVGFGGRDAPGDEDTPYDADVVYGRTGVLRAYHDTKLEGERVTVDAGGVVVNPDYVLGAWDVKPTSGQLLLSIARGWVPLWPRGGKCFVDAVDCAEGHLLALERGVPGRRYLLGNHNLSYREFMDACARAAGRPGPILPVPRLVVGLAGTAGRVLQRVDPHRYAGLTREVLAAMQSERYRSGRRSWEELGVPRRPIATSIADALDWFRANGYLAGPGGRG